MSFLYPFAPVALAGTAILVLPLNVVPAPPVTGAGAPDPQSTARRHWNAAQAALKKFHMEFPEAVTSTIQEEQHVSRG